MKKDPRLAKVTFECEAYTQPAWDEHVDALGEVIEEIQEEERDGKANVRRGGQSAPRERSGAALCDADGRGAIAAGPDSKLEIG